MGKTNEELKELLNTFGVKVVEPKPTSTTKENKPKKKSKQDIFYENFNYESAKAQLSQSQLQAKLMQKALMDNNKVVPLIRSLQLFVPTQPVIPGGEVTWSSIWTPDEIKALKRKLFTELM